MCGPRSITFEKASEKKSLSRKKKKNSAGRARREKVFSTDTGAANIQARWRKKKLRAKKEKKWRGRESLKNGSEVKKTLKTVIQGLR